jgi:hypothetical protein
MRTDGEIKRLSEMPADSIVAATTKKDLGTSRWQLYGKATSLSQEYGRGPWQVLCRFSDAGNYEPFHPLMRPASEKRQGTKSRREVVRRRCRKLYGVLVTGVSWRRDDLPRAIRVERGYNLNVTARILPNGEFTFCPTHDFNELRVARERDRQLVRDELPDNLWMSDSIERLIWTSKVSAGPSWTFLICSSRQSSCSRV